MPELPRLDNLVWLPNPRGDDRDGVLHADCRNRRGHERPYKIQGLRLFRPFLAEVPRPGNGKMGARRMEYRQVPAVANDLPHVTLYVVLGAVFRREEVT